MDVGHRKRQKIKSLVGDRDGTKVVGRRQKKHAEYTRKTAELTKM